MFENCAAEVKASETGIWKVLGATVAAIVELLSKDFLKLVLLSVMIAAPVAWFMISQWLRDFGYTVDISWIIFAMAALICVAIALVTVTVRTIRVAVRNLKKFKIRMRNLTFSRAFLLLLLRG